MLVIWPLSSAWEDKWSIAYTAALVAIYVLWCTSLDYKFGLGQHKMSEASMAVVASKSSSRTSSSAAPFVVLTWQSTGSNLLCGLLHHHHEVYMHSEVRATSFRSFPRSYSDTHFLVRSSTRLASTLLQPHAGRKRSEAGTEIHPVSFEIYLRSHLKFAPA
jgi:hypothetical protein